LILNATDKPSNQPTFSTAILCIGKDIVLSSTDAAVTLDPFKPRIVAYSKKGKTSMRIKTNVKAGATNGDIRVGG